MRGNILRKGRGLLWAAAMVFGLAGLAGPAEAGIVTEEFTVSSSGDVKLYLRNKHSDSLYTAKPDKIVLFLHGASYPAHSSFDYAFEGRSWMDWLAAKGYDVYALDIRGYGKSTRPKEMAAPPEANPPVVDTTQALQDVTAAVDYILSRRGTQKLVLVGWSWGATLAGSFAVSQSDRVERLVLYAPQWLREVVPPTEAEIARVPAWRSVDPRHARDVWLKSVPEAQRASVLSKEAFAAWMAATLASDPETAASGTVRAPNGVVLDTMRYWASGKPRWNPARVTVPTLVIQGEYDAEAPPAMGMQVFNALSPNIFKRYVMVGGTTHAALLEGNRQQLYRAVQEFLETPLQPH